MTLNNYYCGEICQICGQPTGDLVYDLDEMRVCYPCKRRMDEKKKRGV